MRYQRQPQAIFGRDMIVEGIGWLWMPLFLLVMNTAHQIRAIPTTNNVALGKPTNQSSLDDIKGFSKHAVDGIRNGNYMDKSCTSTKRQTNPWWRVDLQKSYVILRFFIVNRADCCGERLDNFEIRIGDSLVSNGNDNPSCGSSYIIPQGGTKSIACHTLLKGRYVNIRIQGPDRSVTLCEVEVYPFIEEEHIDKIYSNLAGHVLPRHIITTLDSGLPLWLCAMQCNTYPGCVSFYYDVTASVCQLSDVKAEHAGGLAPGSFFEYHERVEFIKDVRRE
ncbi:fucolectin isoform X1 [Nematostella vectensis]|uniref:fucolectin isoform X1 n=2 Tax=Nematostella vectensis TaxID=45351 RepID=UPI002077377D|nr:fucolectin isoform X1 [Nematostella vectensis]